VAGSVDIRIQRVGVKPMSLIIVIIFVTIFAIIFVTIFAIIFVTIFAIIFVIRQHCIPLQPIRSSLGKISTPETLSRN